MVAAAVLLALAGGGCAASAPAPVRLRGSTQPEAARVMEAIGPLLIELGYPLTAAASPTLTDGCRIGLVVVPAPWINAGARPGLSSPCVRFTLFLTEGTLRKLPTAQLRAVLAHELGHVHLGHFQQRRDRREAAGPESWWIFRRAYDREEELAADQFAARLLRKLEDRNPGSCIALVFVLELLAEQGTGSAEWLSTHPSPARRAERAEAACNGDMGMLSIFASSSISPVDSSPLMTNDDRGPSDEHRAAAAHGLTSAASDAPAPFAPRADGVRPAAGEYRRAEQRASHPAGGLR